MKKLMIIAVLLLLCICISGQGVFAQEPSQPAASEADQQAAQRVIAQIEALGEITLDSQDAITAAQLAYAKLTPAQRELVTNLDALNAAHVRLQALQHAYAQNNASERITTLQTIRFWLMVTGAAAAVGAAAFFVWRNVYRKRHENAE